MTEQKAEQRTERRKPGESRKEFPNLDFDTQTEEVVSTEPRKQFSYKWYLPAERTKSTGQAPPQPLEPEAPEPEFQESATEPESQDLPSDEVQVQERAMEQIPQEVHTARYRQVHFFKTDWILSNRLRISAVSGWSTVSAIGAVVILGRHGPTMLTSIAELGAAWAGISIGLWIFTSKIRR